MRKWKFCPPRTVRLATSLAMLGEMTHFKSMCCCNFPIESNTLGRLCREWIRKIKR